MSRRGVLAAGLWFLVFAQVAVSAVQLFAPAVFYRGFPLPGHPWVALLPAYNEHLLRDVGALNLALGMIAGIAAVALERRIVLAALGGILLFAIPHLAFHALHLRPFPPVDAAAQTVALAVNVALPALLVVPATRLPLGVTHVAQSRPRTAEDGGPSRSISRSPRAD